MLRQLVQRYGRRDDRLIREYAAAEQRGSVHLDSNEYGISAEEYAAGLIADAKQKGWLKRR